jgi:hypothetical protein
MTYQSGIGSLPCICLVRVRRAPFIELVFIKKKTVPIHRQLVGERVLHRLMIIVQFDLLLICAVLDRRLSFSFFPPPHPPSAYLPSTAPLSLSLTLCLSLSVSVSPFKPFSRPSVRQFH